MMRTVSVVAGNETKRRIYRALLARLGCLTRLAGTAAEAHMLLADELIDFAMIELDLPGGLEGDLISTIRAANAAKPLPIIAVGPSSTQDGEAALSAGAVVAQKPFAVKDLACAMQRVAPMCPGL